MRWEPSGWHRFRDVTPRPPKRQTVQNSLNQELLAPGRPSDRCRGKHAPAAPGEVWQAAKGCCRRCSRRGRPAGARDVSGPHTDRKCELAYIADFNRLPERVVLFERTQHCLVAPLERGFLAAIQQSLARRARARGAKHISVARQCRHEVIRGSPERFARKEGMVEGGTDERLEVPVREVVCAD